MAKVWRKIEFKQYTEEDAATLETYQDEGHVTSLSLIFVRYSISKNVCTMNCNTKCYNGYLLAQGPQIRRI